MDVTNKAIDNATKTTIVTQPMMFPMPLFTYFPMTSLLLMINIIKINTTGNRMPLILCDHNEMAIRGALGIRIIPAPIIIMMVYSQ